MWKLKVYLREKRYGGEYWMKLAEDRFEWRAFVNTAMNFRVS
jgi:hypothetical protein